MSRGVHVVTRSQQWEHVRYTQLCRGTGGNVRRTGMGQLWVPTILLRAEQRPPVAAPTFPLTGLRHNRLHSLRKQGGHLTRRAGADTVNNSRCHRREIDVEGRCRFSNVTPSVT